MDAALRRWTLQCGDGFELRDPQGEVVKLPYRKVEELFSLLALRPGQPVSRSYLARELWPTADRAIQQVNLRQTLSRLRAALGEENVLAGRTHCSLSPEMPVSVNRSAKVRQCGSPASDLLGPMLGFSQMVQFLAISNPPQMLEMMRSNNDLGLGMAPVDILRSLDIVRKQIPANHPLAGWIEFWAGYAVLVANKVDQACLHFQQARLQGIAARDYALVSSVVFWEGAARILLGRIGEAARLAEMGSSVLDGRDGGKYRTR